MNRGSVKRLRTVGTWLGLTVAAILVSLSLTCSMDVIAHVNGEPLSDYSLVNGALYLCIQSFSSDRMSANAIALLAGILLYHLPKLKPTRKERALADIFAFCFSIMQLIGRSYSVNNSWDAIVGSVPVMSRTLIVFTGLFILSRCGVLYAFRLMDRLSVCAAGKPKKLSVKCVLLSSGIIFLCWLPYYIFFFPGFDTADTAHQIAWFFHRHTWNLDMSPLRGAGIYANNHHPYFLTLLYGSAVQLGHLLGSYTYGIGIVAFGQMLLMAAVLSGMWNYLRSIGLSAEICKGGILFSALFPLFPMYAITLVKDTLFSIFALLLLLLTADVVVTEGESLKRPRSSAAVFIVSFLVMLTKSQGVYIVAVIAVVYAVVYRHHWKQVAAALIVPVLLFQIGWINILLPALHVGPAGKQEMIGLLFQQTARFARDYPEEVTEEEADAIRAVIDYDNMVKLYNPRLSDPVKNTFNQDATDEDISNFYHVWFQLFLKHPDCYVQAFLNNIYGFFFFNQNSALTYKQLENRVPEDDELFMENSERVVQAHEAIGQVTLSLLSIPIVSLFFAPGILVWIVLFVFLDVIRKRRYVYILPQMFYILSVGVLFVSPISGDFRYTMPIFYAVPFLICTCLLLSKKEQL